MFNYKIYNDKFPVYISSDAGKITIPNCYVGYQNKITKEICNNIDNLPTPDIYVYSSGSTSFITDVSLEKKKTKTYII